MALNEIPLGLYGFDQGKAITLIEKLGAPAYRSKQLLEWVFEKKVSSFSQMKTLPKDLLEKIEKEVPLRVLTLEEKLPSSNGESTKFLFRTKDDYLLETVLISQNDRETVCVSIQLGCKIGCTFCASGKGKFGRNLNASEVIEQIVRVEQERGRKITNIVFMGMGEPLDNYEVTMKALEILQAKWGLFMSGRRITVSTSGITPKIIDFVKSEEGRVRLSISLHSSQEEKRTELVPINKKYSLKELIETLEHVNETLKREITFEYTLIKDQNDSQKEAHGVGKIAKSLRAKVNIIPYNPISEMDFQRPEQKVIQKFESILSSYGLRVIVRQTAGRDINAACGQLRLDREKATS
jgi:23S rRNA (adenine2503-C2)-methyltransferase